MKVGYKRLLIFITVIFIVLLTNSFIVNFLSRYKITLFILLLLAIFHNIFVCERNKNRYLKIILFELFLYIATYFILFYLLGLIVGIAKNTNYYSLLGLFNYILPVTLYCIVREIFRYNMLCKADNNKLCTILVIILFILMDITNNIYYYQYNSQYQILNFIALILLPAISRNISYSFISKKIGYIPIIIFDLVMVLYPYLLPIIPNPSEYLLSIIYLIVPVLFAVMILKFFNLKKDDMIPRDYYKKKFKGIITPIVLILLMVYFYSGYFRFYAIAIATNSMEPKIHKGDIVIIDQKKEELKVGDIIAFKQKKVIIVHRIAKIIKVNSTTYYYTKGDSNNQIDNIAVTDKMILGRIKCKIPLIGYPTVWFGEL